MVSRYASFAAGQETPRSTKYQVPIYIPSPVIDTWYVRKSGALSQVHVAKRPMIIRNLVALGTAGHHLSEAPTVEQRGGDSELNRVCVVGMVRTLRVSRFEGLTRCGVAGAPIMATEMTSRTLSCLYDTADLRLEHPQTPRVLQILLESCAAICSSATALNPYT